MFKLFEIFNEHNKRMFVTEKAVCLPKREHVNSMLLNRYKIKIDGKIATKKIINEIYLKAKRG